MTVTSVVSHLCCQSSLKTVHKSEKEMCSQDNLWREAKANVSHLNLACSSESIVFLYMYVFNLFCFKLSAKTRTKTGRI